MSSPRVSSTRSLRAEEGGTPPNGSVHTSNDIQERGGVGGLNQEENNRVPLKQRALPAHGIQSSEGGVTPDQDTKRGGHPPSSMRSQSTACRSGGEAGGAPPKQERTPLVRGLIQEMGGRQQDLQKFHTARQSVADGQDKRYGNIQELKRAHLPH